MSTTQRVVVAGHLCLDIVPHITDSTSTESRQMFKGGQLTTVGPLTFSPGGVVANTGGALRRLGVDTTLIGKTGADQLGELTKDLLAGGGASDQLPGEARLVSDPKLSTSYTVVLTPPDIDRIYLHCPSSNDSFTSDDIDYNVVRDCSIFHFGYPPLMARMYERDGQELARVFSRARDAGAVTSLDMAMPDPGSAAGRAPWRKILENSLPNVDIFLPSVEETIRMLHRDWETEKVSSERRYGATTLERLRILSTELLEMGARVVVLKLGSDGVYVRTALSSAQGTLPDTLKQVAENFGDREIYSSCYSVEVTSTVGSGDATIAGFLAGLLKGLPLVECINVALAVGAISVEHLLCTGGIPTYSAVIDRMRNGWVKPGHAGGDSKPSPEWDYNKESDLYERR